MHLLSIKITGRFTTCLHAHALSYGQRRIQVATLLSIDCIPTIHRNEFIIHEGKIKHESIFFVHEEGRFPELTGLTGCLIVRCIFSV